jgi:hypothetical protein
MWAMWSASLFLYVQQGIVARLLFDLGLGVLRNKILVFFFKDFLKMLPT